MKITVILFRFNSYWHNTLCYSFYSIFYRNHGYV